MIFSTRTALLVTASFLLCACDTPPPVVKPLDDITPTPPPPSVDAPAFLQYSKFTLVMEVKLDPNITPGAPSAKFFDMVRENSATWGNDFIETLYVVKPAVRREIESDALDKIFIDLYRPDGHLCWKWKTGAVVKAVDGSVEQRSYVDTNPLENAVHLGFAGKWSQLSADEVVFNHHYTLLELTQDDGGVLDVLIDKTTNFPFHIQSHDASIVCSVKEFHAGPDSHPDPTLFAPPTGVFIDKLDPTPGP